MQYHEPVMLPEAIAHLNVKKDGLFIDATLGDAGHTIALLKTGAKVLGLDYDPVAITRATERITKLGFGAQFTGVCGNFKQIDELATARGFGQVDGILYDLGYSSYQLDEGASGLSFSHDEPLDMRLDKTLGVTAADLVNFLSEDQLAKLIFDYSDEKLARKFAKAIIKHRSLKKIQTTAQLAEILKSESSSGYEHGRIHPATRTFQALRIAVNDEVSNLKDSLPRAVPLLKVGSRMVVISFHSLEDEIVKKFGKQALPTLKTLYKKPLAPSEAEVRQNVRSRSAKMRVFEKC